MNRRFVYSTDFDLPAEVLFQWHLYPGAFERLVPPWEKLTLERREGSIHEEGIVRLAMQMGPFVLPWVAKHLDYQEGIQFADTLLQGPFSQWYHQHRVERLTDTTARLIEDITYTLPLAPLSHWVAGDWVDQKLQRLFRYRHRQTANDLKCHQHYCLSKGEGVRAMKILVTGASGLVGSALVPFLTTGGHEVVRLVRRKSQNSPFQDIYWNPEKGEIDTAGLEGLDAVVHLAGENIASGRWTPEKKAQIQKSRVEGTRLLSEALAKLNNPPKVLVNASAIGYYGDRGTESLTEESAAGTGFLPEVCKAWEAATQPAQDRGIRVVKLRIGIVLSPKGGALSRMLPPFQLGAGGPLGCGKQYMSWIALDDAVGAIYHALHTESLSGPVNAVSPHPMTNRDFSWVLGKVLFRPAFAPVPSFAVKLLFGEMGEALLLSSAQVHPTQLEQTGYTFLYPELEPALRHLLK